jgi:hypothetical protein
MIIIVSNCAQRQRPTGYVSLALYNSSLSLSANSTIQGFYKKLDNDCDLSKCIPVFPDKTAKVSEPFTLMYTLKVLYS